MMNRRERRGVRKVLEDARRAEGFDQAGYEAFVAEATRRDRRPADYTIRLRSGQVVGVERG